MTIILGLTTAILGLIAALAAALISRSVMVGNHRQAWINALRDDLAQFFTCIDVLHFKMAALAQRGESSRLEDQQRARNEALLAYRKILMRLNMSEPLHQRLEGMLSQLLVIEGKSTNQENLNAAVTLARTILKREWEVTKYGPFTAPISALKRRRTHRSSREE